MPPATFPPYSAVNTATVPEMGNKCDCCGKPAGDGVVLFRCSSCRSRFYCVSVFLGDIQKLTYVKSPECQMAEWKRGHRKSCTKKKPQLARSATSDGSISPP